MNSVEENTMPSVNEELGKATGLQRKIVMGAIAATLIGISVSLYFGIHALGGWFGSIGNSGADKKKVSAGVAVAEKPVDLQKDFDKPVVASAPKVPPPTNPALTPDASDAALSKALAQRTKAKCTPEVTYDIKGNPVVICADNGSTVKESQANAGNKGAGGRRQAEFNRLDVPLGVSSVSPPPAPSANSGYANNISNNQYSVADTRRESPQYIQPVDANKVVSGYLDRIKSVNADLQGGNHSPFAPPAPSPVGRPGGVGAAGAGTGAGSSGSGALEGAFTNSHLSGVRAGKLTDLDLLWPKGAGVDCVLDGAIDASTSGYVTCTIGENKYSANGHTLLVEKGSTAFLEYRATSAQGQTRFPLIATSIRTANGISFDIDSGAQGPLGETGASGYVDNRWGDRLGAAMLVAIIGDVMSYEIAKNSPAGQAGVPSYQQSQGVAQSIPGQVLQSTINIKPRILKLQGETVRIVAARDVDFSTVYKLTKE
ncbi:MAG TPA: TrbI/VirB10 family protein [Methylobacter sp.]|jgi:type IV secretion system protein VirB10